MTVTVLHAGRQYDTSLAEVTAALLVIGDEILSGRTKDKNIGFIADHCTEIGIRLALGAQREHVLHLMLLDGLAPALGGAAAGSLLAIAAAQLIRSSLYATKPLDPAVFAGVIGLLFGVATAACLLPAWRASRVQPATVLRSE